MVLLGIILIVLGLLAPIHILFIIGIILLVIGLAAGFAGGIGYPVGPRRHYW